VNDDQSIFRDVTEATKFTDVISFKRESYANKGTAIPSRSGKKGCKCRPKIDAVSIDN
jgi:hypothetical protein